MAKILISGLVNIETTLITDGFPIQYCPVRYPFFGVNSSVSGVGFNVAAALKTLGDDVRLVSMLGRDAAGKTALFRLDELKLDDTFIPLNLKETPQSVIIYDNTGDRQINVDLKDIQKTPYPEDLFDLALKDCDAAALCNINFSRPYLEYARRRGVMIATDVHAVSDLDDEYNRDFMFYSEVLFMSDELLPCPAFDWAGRVYDRFKNRVIVIGMGRHGAVLCVEGKARHYYPVFTRPVVNTIGAGDALFSCFLHYFVKTGDAADAADAMERAMIFASYKVGGRGAAEGFLTEKEIEEEFLPDYMKE